MAKDILVSVSYGASDETLAADIGRIESALQAAMPGWELRRAFTSPLVRARLAKQGKEVPDAAGAIAQARADGAERIAAAALLVSPGGEFESVEAASRALHVITPLLADDVDLDTLAGYFGEVQRKNGRPLVLMGHGSPTSGNPAYARLRERLPENVYLACLSGHDNLAWLMPELLRHSEREITLMPLLMSVGGHTLNDMAGDGGDSWKSQLEKAGFKVECRLTGIGRLDVVQSIFVRKAKKIVG